MSRLSDSLAARRFVVTSELNPPKGTDLSPVFARAEPLRDCVDAFNLTDSHAARMSISPMATAHLLLDKGIEPIMQMTSRDRNRIALQGDLLGAAALGVTNVVFMGGDPPHIGDHPEAKPVFDILSVALLRTARSLEAGRDLNGNTLCGTPRYCLGAVVNPGAGDLGKEVDRMKRKVDAGAEFLQTQAVYEPAVFDRFMNAVHDVDVAILAGVILLKSPTMAAFMNDKVPGIHVPAALVDEIAGVEDRAAKSIEIAARIIQAIKPLCQGIHIMPLGWEEKIPGLLQAAGLPGTPG